MRWRDIENYKIALDDESCNYAIISDSGQKVNDYKLYKLRVCFMSPDESHIRCTIVFYDAKIETLMVHAETLLKKEFAYLSFL